MYRTTTAITDNWAIGYLLTVDGTTGLFIHFGMFTALRISEILGLKWGDVLIDGRVKDSVVLYISKQKKHREISFHADLKARIKDVQMRTNPRLDSYIFVSESNNTKGNVPITTEAMNLRLKPILLKVGAQHPSSHTLRKTMARRYFEQFGLVPTMQLLGHSSEAMTMVYIGLSREKMSINMKSLYYGNV